MNYKIVAKYIKNLNFKIPNPKTFFLLSKDIANYKINIDIKSNQFEKKIIEVETSLSLNPIKNDFEKTDTKIVRSTIVELTSETQDKKELEKIILIDIPTQIYPDIRNSFIFLFEKSGFKEIKIDEFVDFKKLHDKKTIQ